MAANNAHWVGSWTTSPALVDEARVENRTLRMIARTSLAGERVRLRFSNAHGTKPLTIANASIALRAGGAEIVAGSARPLTFGGERAMTVAVGALAVSDPVDFALPALADIAITFHAPGSISDVTGHKTARQTNYVSTPGDHTGDAAFPVERAMESWYFCAGIETIAPGAKGIVCLGDSLTDANVSTVDANVRWTDQFARRLVAAHGQRAFGVMNQGIGGNRLLHDTTGDSAQRRFDRDVLAQPGATHLIVLIGTNDLRNRREIPGQEAAAAPMIAGYKQLARRAKAAGLKAIACTLTPYEKESFYEFGWSPEREQVRLAVNAWLRSQNEFDAIVDFDKEMRDPAAPSKLLPVWDCGDHLHPSDAGYLKMGDIVMESGVLE